MTYAGIPDPEERAQLLAFLEVATRGPECERVPVASRP
jgi:cytochrome c2